MLIEIAAYICNLILRTAMFEDLNEILVFNIAPQFCYLLQVVKLTM